jgi:hypothetical protein
MPFEDQLGNSPFFKGGKGDFLNLENGPNSVTCRYEDTHILETLTSNNTSFVRTFFYRKGWAEKREIPVLISLHEL